MTSVRFGSEAELSTRATSHSPLRNPADDNTLLAPLHAGFFSDAGAFQYGVGVRCRPPGPLRIPSLEASGSKHPLIIDPAFPDSWTSAPAPFLVWGFTALLIQKIFLGSLSRLIFRKSGGGGR